MTLNPAIDLNLTIEAWPRGDLARTVRAERSAGGKGINVARVLAALGVRAEAFCLLGRGPDAGVFRLLTDKFPFDLFIHEIEGTVRTNVTVVCARGGQLKVNQPGPELRGAAWKRAEIALAARMAGREWVVLSGALPPGADEDAYARLVRRAHRAGARVALDCAGAALAAALTEKPDLIKPNREELEATLGVRCRTRAEAAAAGRELLARGARCAIVSGGGRECLAITKEATECRQDACATAWRARPPKIVAIGPMGAGDSLLAGFIAGLMKGEGIGEALRLGVACGTATAALPNTVFCNGRDVKRQMSNVKCPMSMASGKWRVASD